jgi:hypothetical protein
LAGGSASPTCALQQLLARPAPSFIVMVLIAFTLSAPPIAASASSARLFAVGGEQPPRRQRILRENHRES